MIVSYILLSEESLSDGRQCYASALPCKPAQFCGRDERLDEIVRVLSETNGRRLVVITGSPGCGKSFLAKKIGLAMLEKHFQVIFLCLREIRSVAKMAARILLSLKTYAWQGLVNNQRPELALSRLKLLTTRTVLILDNAEYLINDSNESKILFKFVNQVVQFASNVKCVVTSRVDYPSDCCQTPHHLVKLTAPKNVAAAKLLQEKVKENSGFTLEDAEAKAIAGFCFNIPLTLHKVAAYLEVVPTQTLIQILEKDQSTPLDVMDVDELSPDLKVKCFLHDCLQQLGSELEEALVSLAVFPGAFDYQQAMDVFGSNRLHANLVQLVKRSLVHSCLNSNHYFVHRVIQLCCEEKAKTDERLRTCYKKARQRFIEHYLNLITDLHRRFLCKGGLNKTLCHYWMEEQHILQAIWWAVTSGNTTLSTSCAEILNEAVIFLAKVMKKDEFEHVYEVVLNDIKGDLRLVADCLTCVGIKQVFSCEFHRVCSTVSKRGYRVLQRALEIYEELNLTDGELVAQCYSKIGRCMAKNGNPTRAFELSEKALEIWEKKREEEPLKYAACCNDRAGITFFI